MRDGYIWRLSPYLFCMEAVVGGTEASTCTLNRYPQINQVGPLGTSGSAIHLHGYM